MKIKKTPGNEIEVNMFRRSDSVYVDIDKEQYVLSLKDILDLEDMDKRSNVTS